MFDPYSRDQYEFTKSYTFYILVANVIVFIIQLLYEPFTELFALIPNMAFKGYVWQFVTYMFLHGGFMHIFFNMLVLMIFGFTVERVLGKQRFLTVYVLSGIGSAVFYILIMSMMGGSGSVPLLGASGAIFGLLAAYAFLFPKSWVFIWGFIPLPASVLIIFLLVEETFFGFLGLQPGIANFGHVGGIVTGLLIMLVWRFDKLRREKKAGMKDYQFIWE